MYKPIKWRATRNDGPIHAFADGQPLCGYFASRGYTRCDEPGYGLPKGDYCRTCIIKSGVTVGGALL